jgi:signal peptide peptidase SppA
MDRPWAIRPEALEVIIDIVRDRSLGEVLSDGELAERLAGRAEKKPSEIGSVAVLPLYGSLFPRANLFSDISGGTSLEVFANRLGELDRDPRVTAIIFDIASPGGTVDMVPETAEKIRNTSTRTVAVANTEAASAAYWLASQADELVVTPSGEVGSIGVWTAHQNMARAEEMKGVQTTLISAGKYKVEGHPFGPLGDEAAEALQSKVDAYYEMFVSDVALGREVSTDTVRSGFGEGRMLLATSALAEGMVDRIATLEQVIRSEAGASTPTAIAAAASVADQHYFDNPGFGIPGVDPRLRYDPDSQTWSCPVTVSGDHIFGHVAAMGVCLRGRPAACITPPDGDLEGFMRGYAPAAGGQRTGVVVVGGSHADIGVGVIEASKHYDKTGRAGADVRVGRDAYGIWFSGMIRPGLSKEDRYALAASDVSGHWEMGQRGVPVLVGLPAVNVGGFPKGYLTADEVARGVAASLRLDDCDEPDTLADIIERVRERV